MKIKLKHELGTIDIETDVYDDPDETVVPRITFEGDKTLQYLFYETADRSYGAYGHGFNIKETTNLDLDYACRMMEGFEIVESDPIEGIKANPDFPKAGCVS